MTGVASIFVTKRWLARGTRAAMLQGCVWSALRMLLQIFALTVGGARGVLITLAAQLLCSLGSPGGFILATNSALMEVVAAEQRTAMFGVLSGAHMAGLAVGLLCVYIIGAGDLTSSWWRYLLPVGTVRAVRVRSHAPCRCRRSWLGDHPVRPPELRAGRKAAHRTRHAQTALTP